MSRWTLVALAPATHLAGGAQADPQSVSVSGELEAVVADDAVFGMSEASDGSGSGMSSSRLHREGGPEGVADVVVSGMSCTDRNTPSGASYAYTVHTLDAVGNELGARGRGGGKDKKK